MYSKLLQVPTRIASSVFRSMKAYSKHICILQHVIKKSLLGILMVKFHNLHALTSCGFSNCSLTLHCAHSNRTWTVCPLYASVCVVSFGHCCIGGSHIYNIRTNGSYPDDACFYNACNEAKWVLCPTARLQNNTNRTCL